MVVVPKKEQYPRGSSGSSRAFRASAGRSPCATALHCFAGRRRHSVTHPSTGPCARIPPPLRIAGSQPRSGHFETWSLARGLHRARPSCAHRGTRSHLQIRSARPPARPHAVFRGSPARGLAPGGRMEKPWQAAQEAALLVLTEWLEVGPEGAFPDIADAFSAALAVAACLLRARRVSPQEWQQNWPLEARRVFAHVFVAAQNEVYATEVWGTLGTFEDAVEHLARWEWPSAVAHSRVPAHRSSPYRGAAWRSAWDCMASPG